MKLTTLQCVHFALENQSMENIDSLIEWWLETTNNPKKDTVLPRIIEIKQQRNVIQEIQ